MAQVELIMPKMGESITEATVLSWLKKPGDKIEQEESVLEVATDKVDTEIPSTHAGILKEILVQKGEIVLVGKPIAILTVEAEESTTNENGIASRRSPSGRHSISGSPRSQKRSQQDAQMEKIMLQQTINQAPNFFLHSLKISPKKKISVSRNWKPLKARALKVASPKKIFSTTLKPENLDLRSSPFSILLQ